MFFDLFYGKLNKGLKCQLENLYDEIRSLRTELEGSNETSEFEKNRYERIQYLLNERVHIGSSCTIETTDKGITVLAAVKDVGTEFEAEIFNLDNCERFTKRNLVLWAKYNGDHYHITDIQDGEGHGHGSTAMSHLLAHIYRHNADPSNLPISYISGKLYTEGAKNQERQDSFYKKWGYSINRERMVIRRNI